MYLLVSTCDRPHCSRPTASSYVRNEQLLMPALSVKPVAVTGLLTALHCGAETTSSTADAPRLHGNQHACGEQRNEHFRTTCAHAEASREAFHFRHWVCFKVLGSRTGRTTKHLLHLRNIQIQIKARTYDPDCTS